MRLVAFTARESIPLRRSSSTSSQIRRVLTRRSRPWRENCTRRRAMLGAHATSSGGSSAWRRTCSPGSAICRCLRFRHHFFRRCAESRAAEPTKRRIRCGRRQARCFFRYGVATGRCKRNPAADLHGALRPIIMKHMAAVLEPSGVGALMRSIAEYSGNRSLGPRSSCRQCCSSARATFDTWHGAKSILRGSSGQSLRLR